MDLGTPEGWRPVLSLMDFITNYYSPPPWSACLHPPHTETTLKRTFLPPPPPPPLPTQTPYSLCIRTTPPAGAYEKDTGTSKKTPMHKTNKIPSKVTYNR